MADEHDVSPQRAFLDRVLAGAEIDPTEIDALLEARVEEDLSLDYKSGLILNRHDGKALLGRPKTFDGKIRKHIAGFANAEGGVLIIGVNEPEKRRNPHTHEWVRDPTKLREVDGLVGIGPERARELAAEAIKRLRPSLSVSIRVQAVEHMKGLVLLVAVPRSDSLVIAVENEQAVHYLRMHDETVHAPGYLVEDLVLGRRRRPVIRASAGETEVVWESSGTATIQLRLQFDNEGFAYADTPMVGLLHAAGGVAPPGTAAQLISRARLIPNPDLEHLAHYPHPKHLTEVTLAPFQTLRFEPRLVFPARISQRYLWSAAVYFVSRQGLPAWYQVRVDTYISGIKGGGSRTTTTITHVPDGVIEVGLQKA